MWERLQDFLSPEFAAIVIVGMVILHHLNVVIANLNTINEQLLAIVSRMDRKT